MLRSQNLLIEHDCSVQEGQNDPKLRSKRVITIGVATKNVNEEPGLMRDEMTHTNENLCYSKQFLKNELYYYSFHTESLL